MDPGVGVGLLAVAWLVATVVLNLGVLAVFKYFDFGIDSARAALAAFRSRPGWTAVLLGLNGLRVSEACATNVEDLGFERGHRTLTVLRTGCKIVTVPRAPRTARAIELAIRERVERPLFLGHKGERGDRHAAWRIVRRLARRAGINKPVGPHTLRHAFITAALDAGVPLRDVQEAASHADPRTTMRYDRARVSLDRHATYIVAAFLADASPDAYERMVERYPDNVQIPQYRTELALARQDFAAASRSPVSSYISARL